MSRRRLTRAVRRAWASLSFPVRLTLASLAGSAAVPWVLRLYAAWWDLAWGRGAWCAAFIPPSP